MNKLIDTLIQLNEESIFKDPSEEELVGRRKKQAKEWAASPIYGMIIQALLDANIDILHVSVWTIATLPELREINIELNTSLDAVRAEKILDKEDSAGKYIITIFKNIVRLRQYF